MRRALLLILTCLSPALVGGCAGNHEAVPNLPIKWHSEFAYDLGIGVLWPASTRRQASYLGIAGSNLALRVEAGLMRYFDGDFGCGRHWGAKLILGTTLDDTSAFDSGESIVGYEIQIGQAGHSPALVLGVGNLWSMGSDNAATFVSTGICF